MHSVNTMDTKKPSSRSDALTPALDADALELFARVAKAGSFSLAARQAGQTRAAVSRRIAYMEQRTGQALFLRTTRSLTLTATGRRLLPHAIAVLDAAEQARGTLTSVRAGLAGSLRITSLPSFGTMVLPPLLLKFHALHPEVNYDLLLSDRRVDLLREGVDIASRDQQAAAGLGGPALPAVPCGGLVRTGALGAHAAPGRTDSGPALAAGAGVHEPGNALGTPRRHRCGHLRPRTCGGAKR